MSVASLITVLGFEWKALKQDAIVVDVGGGIGSQSLILAQHNEHLRFVVQDRESVVKDAVKVSIARLVTTFLDFSCVWCCVFCF